MTCRDLLRRPGAALALFATAWLLLLLPRLARRALDDGDALSVELALSTITLYASLLAVVAGVRAAAPASTLGPTLELLATPLRHAEYVFARALGVTLCALLHAATLTLVAVAGLAWAGTIPSWNPLVLAALTSGVVHVTLHAALGLALGAVCGNALGLVMAAGILVTTRLVVPAWSVAGGAATWWLLDTARLDLSREAGFGHAVGGTALLATGLAALFQVAALLLLARVALRIERP